MAASDAVLTVAQIRAAEQHTMRSVPEEVLMDRAAAAVASEVHALGYGDDARVVVLAGSGNNGGDALLAGALLAADGADVTAVALGATLHARGRRLLEQVGGHIVPPGPEAAAAVGAAHVVLDGIVGIGSRPGLRDDAAGLVARIVAPVVAVDLPSGLDADDAGAALPHVRADVTVTFTALKRCLAEPPARDAAGRIVLADVGIVLD